MQTILAWGGTRSTCQGRWHLRRSLMSKPSTKPCELWFEKRLQRQRQWTQYDPTYCKYGVFRRRHSYHTKIVLALCKRMPSTGMWLPEHLLERLTTTPSPLSRQYFLPVTCRSLRLMMVLRRWQRNAAQDGNRRWSNGALETPTRRRQKPIDRGHTATRSSSSRYL